MQLSKSLASHFRGVFFGGNWTSSNLKTQLENISWEEANLQVKNTNSILALTYHIGYYISGVLKVFEGQPLVIRDKFSYDHPKISSAQEWESMCQTILDNAEALATHIEVLPEARIHSTFVDDKYGSYYDNITGIIEHTHYHLGQIAILKKWLKS
ncbi:MAG: DinB family protein [Algicola sp.]|nr:DinB family protein [Algicola sp.]